MGRPFSVRMIRPDADWPPAHRAEGTPADALRVKVYARRPSGRVAPWRRAAGLKGLAQCLRHRTVTVTTPRRTRMMNTAIITNQMLILIGSTGSPPYCLVPPVRSADVGDASRQASARIMPESLEGGKTRRAGGGAGGRRPSGPAVLSAGRTPPTRRDRASEKRARGTAARLCAPSFGLTPLARCRPHPLTYAARVLD